MTTSIITYIKKAVVEQDRVIALENCLHTWDEGIDTDVILQGIFDRYAAFDKPLKSLRVKRKEFRSVSIVKQLDEYPGEEFTVLCFRLCSPATSVLVGEYRELQIEQGTVMAVGSQIEYFHNQELVAMASYLFKHFHH